MMAIDTPIKGLKVLHFDPVSDARGHFVRTFCAREFERLGLVPTVAQVNSSFSHHAGTIRGMHFQVPPSAEIKVMRCTKGAILEMVVDLRPESPTFLAHFAIELRANDYQALYIPGRFANGYQTLADESQASYHVNEFYAPRYESGLRFDDPRLALPWSGLPPIVSEKDSKWRLLDDERVDTLRRQLADQS